MVLSITTEDGDMMLVQYSDSPDLFDAVDAWRNAERGSSRESHLWQRVLSGAEEYLDRVGRLAIVDNVGILY